ncbi:MAG: ArsR/SmtB family transcription factor [Steroidobacteraceae bacterium]
MLSLPEATRILRAAGESTRLRLLALCALREWSVTELAAGIGQSEPRVSRHLKVLCEAGLLQRARRGQWVCYAAASEGDAAWLVATLLARIDAADAVRRRDAGRAATGARALRPMAPRASKLGRAMAGFIHDSAPGVSLSRLLLLEPLHLELVDAAASLARKLDVVVARADAREALRDYCDRRGVDVGLRARLPAAAAAWGGAIADFSGAQGGDAVESALRELYARLAPSAPLWIMLPYEFLEYSRGNVVAHPITELRRLLAAAGFATERLKPIDEDAHVLVAHARHRASTESAA